MRFLKFLFYAVLTSFFLWVLTVLSGPKLIVFFANRHFGEKIEIENIEVSPRLSVSARKIEIDFPNTSNLSELNGIGSALEINLNFNFAKPVIEISFGQIVLSNGTTITNPSVALTFKDFPDLKEPTYKTKIGLIKAEELGSIENFKSTGILNFERLKLQTVSFEGSDAILRGDLPISSKLFDGKVDFVSLGSPLIEQKNEIYLRASDLEAGTRFSTASMKTTLRNENGKVAFQTNFKDFESTIMRLILPSVSLVGDFSTVDKDIIFTTEAALLNLKLNSSDVFLRGLRANFAHNANFSKMDIVGVLDDLEMATADFYLGLLPTSSLNLSLLLSKGKDLSTITSKADLISRNSDTLLVKAKGEAVVHEKDLVKSCLQSSCDLREINLYSAISANGQNLNINIYCQTINCRDELDLRQIVTDNTKEFFTNLQQENFLNPLFLSYIYNIVLKGSKIGDGHMVRF